MGFAKKGKTASSDTGRGRLLGKKRKKKGGGGPEFTGGLGNGEGEGGGEGGGGEGGNEGGKKSRGDLKN